MEEDYSELAQKCMDFTNQFKHSSHFNFSVNFDTFSFTVTHSKSRKGTEETQRKKKYVSPSNRRRDQRRLKAFLEKKAQHCGTTPSSEEDAKLDTSQSSTSGSTTSPEEQAKLDTSQPPSSPSTTSNIASHNVSNTAPNTTQLSPITANTLNIVTYTQEDLNKRTKHTCDTCGIHFDKSKNLKRHNKKHHQDTITMEQIDGNTSLVEESHSSPSETHDTEKETLILDAIL